MNSDIHNCDIISGECRDLPVIKHDDILDEKILVRIHGSLMICAWIGFASIGIIIARYNSFYCFIIVRDFAFFFTN